MKKLLSSVSCAALVLCLTFQNSHAMMSLEEQVYEEKKEECTNLRPKVNKQKNKNKEQFSLLKENFSTHCHVNFEGLYKHIHYIFKNKELLIDALHPLLPTTLQQPKKKFEHLEFLGDSVLGLVIRARILDLFPDEERGMHNKLYEALICNKTLAEAYLRNLDIEPYLPYPGARECQYCNVVEAIIGAIYKDNSNNDLVQPRKFIMRILDDHLFIQKKSEILEKTSLKNDTQMSFILPNLKKVIDDVLENANVDKTNSKSLLGMILEKTLQDQPKYKLSLGRNANNMPIFIVNVIGAQIGHKITGVGFTKDEAEQNAATNAINFLAQEEQIPQKRLDNGNQTYTKFINDYCQAQGLKLSCKEHKPILNFTCHVKIGDETIGEGSGLSKGFAREEAAHKACQHLTDKKDVNFTKLSNKKYISILQEWAAQNKISDYQLIESTSPATLQFQVMVGENIIAQGEGFLGEAKENAYRSVFDQLLTKQEEVRKDKEIRKRLAKKVKEPSIIILSSHASKPEVAYGSLLENSPEKTEELQIIPIEKAPSLPSSLDLSNQNIKIKNSQKSKRKKEKQAQQTTAITPAPKQNPSQLFAQQSKKQQTSQWETKL